MRWSWPSWVAIVLGLLAVLIAVAVYFALDPTSGYGERMYGMAGPVFIGGAILLAAGLHSLQASYDSWCGDCGYGGGCGCDHCKECADGECCGHCGCEGMNGGHEGHDHK